ncbi:PASTA domain-containing protein [Micromonospora citrea]|uniref:PASTA domain-containing protein n=2 Tax=Micromonospora citrea TaxID=47855 RepID=A0A1C6V0X9_9ACTN|nr:PASTA domain-containing protein [Micromonospora citrea]
MSDDRAEPPAGEGDDRTRPLPPPGGSEPTDRTRRLPGPEGGAPAAGDATRPMPADRTAPMDRTAAVPPGRSGPPAWSGRAEVPPPRPADPREAGTEWYAEEAGGRRWWLPILWGVVALLLLGLFGVGLWLALESADDDPPGPDPSPSVTRASPTTPAPTSAAPTTPSPSATPTTTAAGVPMPPVVNLPLATARAILDDLGLEHRVEYRESDRPEGTVIRTEPEAGEPVPEGEEVTLVVSRGAPSPTGGEPTPTAAPTPTR